MSVKVAIEGCCHGELNTIYNSLEADTELLIICGDFQALRNEADLATINVPRKYLRLGDFHQYYLGQKTASVLTIFIGGNHECLLYLRELQYGGWVAPNIYYLGAFGVVWYRGLRISGLSGIWNFRSFASCLTSDAPEYSLPYLETTIKSIYHVAPKDYLKFLLSGPSDIAISHDWPQGVWNWGDSRQLLRHKPYFREDMNSGRLGSPLAREALALLRPRYWFSLHLHTRFTARVQHQKHRKRIKKEVPANSNELLLDMDGEATENKEDETSKDKNDISGDIELEMDNIDMENLTTSNENKDERGKRDSKKRKVEQAEVTRFLALDKCLPRKRYLEFMSIELVLDHISKTSKKLFYDSKALAIQKVVEDFVASNPQVLQDLGPSKVLSVEKIGNLLTELGESVAFAERKILTKDLEVPDNFEVIAPTDNGAKLQYWPNNQTQYLCEKFKLPVVNLNEA